MTDGLCPDCHAATEAKRDELRHQHSLRLRMITLFGGEKPYREFRFDRYDVTSANRLAFLRARGFNPLRDNLYLWGSCGVGKTHLAYAIAARHCERGVPVSLLKPPQLMRKVRRKDPDEEQQVIDRFIRQEVFVLDDLGIGQETAYARQVFQEILDGRDYRGQAGLVVTSKYSLGALARKLDDDTISSRLAGMCKVVEIRGEDRRLIRSQTPGATAGADPAAA